MSTHGGGKDDGGQRPHVRGQTCRVWSPRTPTSTHRCGVPDQPHRAASSGSSWHTVAGGGGGGGGDDGGGGGVVEGGDSDGGGGGGGEEDGGQRPHVRGQSCRVWSPRTPTSPHRTGVPDQSHRSSLYSGSSWHPVSGGGAGAGGGGEVDGEGGGGDGDVGVHAT